MPENNGKSASEVYEARQLQGDDLPLDTSWKNRQPVQRNPSDLASDAQAREMAENEAVREAYRKISAIMEEDEEAAPRRRQIQQAPTGTLRRKMPTEMTLEDLGATPSRDTGGMSLGDLADGLSSDELATLGLGIMDGVDSAATQAFQDGYVGRGDELSMMAESNARRPQPSVEDWKTEKAMARLTSGKTVPVWIVVNEATGMKIEKPFRIQPPAEKIAVILNITGNANDPRISQIQEDYDKHVQLTKLSRKAGQALTEGRNINQQKYRRLLAELEGVNQRLGI